jgi:2-keto-4-pentenoate hydratase/2-oxohepta-3-ene-1,7-dioic acid hydratase in catechol pathway
MRLGRLLLSGNEEQCVFLDDKSAVLLKDLIPTYDGSYLTNELISQIELLELDRAPRVVFEVSETRSPVVTPRKIICVGLNYQKHAMEMGIDAPSEPIVFMKSPKTMVGGFDNIVIPPNSKKTDYEVELAVIIGEHALYLNSPKDALNCILGYTISQDISEREWQLERGGQWMKGKSFPTFNPLGPCIVTKDELDGDNLKIWSKVNGAVRQDSNTNDLIFDIGFCIWYISQFMELEPGDVVNTGTPEGVGMSRTPSGFLKPGDILESGIEGIGAIKNLVC